MTARELMLALASAQPDDTVVILKETFYKYGSTRIDVFADVAAVAVEEQHEGHLLEGVAIGLSATPPTRRVVIR